MDYSQKAQEILSNVLYLTVATVTPDGEPWNTPVRCAFDEQYNFYWASWTENQHSKNIAANSQVFATVYNSTVPAGTGWGVYIKGEAQMLKDPAEVEQAAVHYLGRIGKDISGYARYLGENPQRIYKLVPSEFWINEGGEVNGEYVDTRVALDILNI